MTTDDTTGESPGDELRDLYASFTQRLAAEPALDIEGMRDLFERWHLGCAEPEDVTYHEAADTPVPATWCLPSGAAGMQRAIVYSHGGGFVVGSRHSHRKLAGHLATQAATPVLVIDYRRAPEHPYPAQVDDTVAVARWLLQAGYSANRIAFAGDSAGGNIAASSSLRLSADGVLAAAVVCMSPWFDMENSGGSLEENASSDAMVNRATLEAMTELVLAGQPANDPGANPLYADLSLLPPTLVTASAHETLRDDATRFVERAEAAGSEVSLHLEPGAQHVFQMAAGRAQAADDSLRQIGKWLQERFER